MTSSILDALAAFQTEAEDLEDDDPGGCEHDGREYSSPERHGGSFIQACPDDEEDDDPAEEDDPGEDNHDAEWDPAEAGVADHDALAEINGGVL